MLTATQRFSEALTLDPAFTLDPQAEAESIYTEVLINQGQISQAVSRLAAQNLISPLKVGEEVSGTVANASDVFFRFEGEADQPITIRQNSAVGLMPIYGSIGLIIPYSMKTR